MVDSPVKPPASDLWVHLGALLFALFFLATSIYISIHRLFWFDEVFTTMTTRLPDWNTVWQALVHDNYDPMPFGYFAIVRSSDLLFGPGELGIRLPSVLGMVGGMLLTYDAARRISNPLHGLIAMAALTCTLLPYYGYEGRAYGMFFFVASLTLWTWITNRPAWVFGLVFFFGVMIHFYMVLCLAPFAVDEIYNWRPGRKPGPRVFAGIIGALAGIAVLSQQVLRSRQAFGHATAFWAAPSLSRLPEIIYGIVPPGLFLLAIGVPLILFVDRRERAPLQPMSPGERTSWFFLVIPFAGFLLAKFVTNSLHQRYLIGTVPGLAIGLAVWLWRRFETSRLVSLGMLALFAGYGMFHQVYAVRHVEEIPAFGPAQERTRTMLAMEDPLWKAGKSYLVMPYTHVYLEARYYSAHPERYMMYTPELTPPAKYYKIPYWTTPDVLQHAREVALVDPNPGLINTLQQAGVHLELKYSGTVPVYYME